MKPVLYFLYLISTIECNRLARCLWHSERNMVLDAASPTSDTCHASYLQCSVTRKFSIEASLSVK